MHKAGVCDESSIRSPPTCFVDSVRQHFPLSSHWNQRKGLPKPQASPLQDEEREFIHLCIQGTFDGRLLYSGQCALGRRQKGSQIKKVCSLPLGGSLAWVSWGHSSGHLQIPLLGSAIITKSLPERLWELDNGDCFWTPGWFCHPYFWLCRVFFAACRLSLGEEHALRVHQLR